MADIGRIQSLKPTPTLLARLPFGNVGTPLEGDTTGNRDPSIEAQDPAPQQTQTPAAAPAKPNKFEGMDFLDITRSLGQQKEDPTVFRAIKEWGATQADDFTAIFKGIPDIAKLIFDGFTEIPAATKTIVNELFTNPKVAGRASLDTLKGVFEATTSHYRDEEGELTWRGFGRGIRDHTFLFALDVLSVASLGSGSIGKMRQVATGAAKQALASGNRGLAKSWLTAAKRLRAAERSIGAVSGAPGKLANLAIRGAEKAPVLGGVLHALGYTEKGRETARILGSHSLDSLRRHIKQLEKSILLRIPSNQKRKALRVMGQVEKLIPAEWDANFLQRYKEYARLINEVQDQLEIKQAMLSTGLANKAAWSGARDKKAALLLREERLHDLGISPNSRLGREAMESALSNDEIARAKTRRAEVLTPLDNTPESLEWAKIQGDLTLSWKREYGTTLDDAISQMLDPSPAKSFQRSGLLSRFFPGPLRESIARMQSRYATASANLLGKLNGYIEVLRRNARFISHSEEVPKGWKAAHGIKVLEQNFNNEQIAKTILMEHFRDAMVKGGRESDVAAAIRAAGDDIDRAVADKMLKALTSEKQIMIIPSDVARVLEMDLAPVFGFWKGYDKVLDYWRDLVLTWSPRFYVNNILGNAVLSTIYGVMPYHGARHGMTQKVGEMGQIVMSSEGMTGVASSYLKKASIAVDSIPREVVFASAALRKAAERTGVLNTLSSRFKGLSMLEKQDLMVAFRNEHLKLSADLITSSLVNPKAAEIPAMIKLRDRMAAQLDTRARAAMANIGFWEQIIAGQTEVVGRLAGELNAMTSTGRRVSRRQVADASAELERARARLVVSKGKLKEARDVSLREVQRESHKIQQLSEQINIYDAELVEASRTMGLLKNTERRLAPFRKTVDSAIEDVETFFGAYGRLTPLERKYIRRVIPFWTFMKTMNALALKLPLIRPKTTLALHRLSQMAMESFDDESLPDYLRGALFVGTTVNNAGEERAVFLRAQGYQVFESLGMRAFGKVPIPHITSPENSPLISVAIKLVGGSDRFERPAPLGTQEFSDPLRRVWKWDDTRKEWNRVSAQTPVLDALGEIIPQIAYLNDFMSPFGIRVPGAGPKIYKDFEGNPKNPRHWSWGFGRMLGFSVDSADMKRARMQNRIQLARNMRLALKKLRFTKDPDERAQIIKIIADVRNNLSEAKIRTR